MIVNIFILMTDNFQDDDNVQNDDERYKRQSETEPKKETTDEEKEVVSTCTDYCSIIHFINQVNSLI